MRSTKRSPAPERRALASRATGAPSVALDGRIESDILTRMRSTISATDASRNFSSLLDRVQHHRDEFVVERAGTPVCTITPAAPMRSTMADLVAFLREHPLPDATFAEDVRAISRRQPRAATRSPWER
jgi:prevent-host-death family protein